MSDGSFDENVKSCFVLLHALNDLFIIRKGNAMLAKNHTMRPPY